MTADKTTLILRRAQGRVV